jgi:metal-sulfur cluster biosynthetic enzyme
MATQQEVYDVLKNCYDPEIPINIVDLGLIYDVKIEDSKVAVKMTLTARGCHMSTSISEDARQKIMSLPGITDATVEVVWDPPWNAEMITDEGKKKLGLPTG